MLKNKIVAAGLATMLAMPFGLTACGSQPATSQPAAQETKTDTATTEKAKEAEEAAKVLYWEGKTSDGQEVFYMDDEKDSTALLAIGKSDGSDGKGWAGKATVEDYKITITDDTSKETISLTVVDSNADATALKVEIEGYGTVEMKPTTQGEFDKQVEEVVTTAATAAATAAATEAADQLSKATIYWQGTLADGSEVVYMDDAETKEAFIAVSPANVTDPSEIQAWGGKVSVADGKNTITDEESKQAVSYTVVSGDSKSSVMKLNIDNYGEVELKSVTGGEVGEEIAKLAEEFSKQVK